jgi:hypothetical protein
VVLIVITVEPISADRLEVFETVHMLSNNSQIAIIIRTIDWISLGNAKYDPILNIGSLSEADLFNFPLGQINQF